MVKQAIQEIDETRRQVTKLMKRILMQFRTIMDEELRPYGVTTAQVRMLGALRNVPGSSGAQLARLCDMTPQSAQGLIERAQEAGWIVRGKDSVNERIVTAALTPDGSQVLETADRLLRGIEGRLWDGIPEAALQDLIGVLEKCVLNIGDEQGTKGRCGPATGIDSSTGMGSPPGYARDSSG